MAGGESQDLGALLSSLLSSPEVIGKLLSVLGSAGEAQGGGESTAVPASAEADESGTGEIAVSAAASSAASASPSNGRRDGLLRALRPYLSPGRCRRLDGLMRISPMLGYLHTDRTAK